mgnify:CR=1 FL=1
MKRFFAASMTTKKLQLRLELNNIRLEDMSVADYTSKRKEICDTLGSIKVMVDKDEMVQVYLGSLAQRFGSF